MNIKKTIQINLNHSSGYSKVKSVGALIAMVIFTSKGIGILSTKWVETKSTRFVCSDVYKRMEDNKSFHAFTTTYFFRANQTTHEHLEESIYESSENANYYLSTRLKNQNAVSVWFDKNDPTNSQINEKPNWSIYFWMNIIPILMLLYNSWIAHKQYEQSRA